MRGTCTPAPAGGEEGGTRLSARTSASAAGRRPSPPRTWTHGPTCAQPQQLRRLLDPAARAAAAWRALCYQLHGFRERAGSRRKPGAGRRGARSPVGGLLSAAAPTASRVLPGYPYSSHRLLGAFNETRRAPVNSTLRRQLRPLFPESQRRGVLVWERRCSWRMPRWLCI